jgi:DNA-binding transcriptional LysR family regulator
MEMQQIRYFLKVCETLNFTQAAILSNVTQPALTRSIQKLEEELGGLLFRRERRLTHITDLGNLLRPQLELIVRQAELTKSTASGFMKLEDAPLKLGVMCTIGPMRFVSFLSRFGKENTGIEISMVEAPSGNLIEMLVAGELDLSIMTPPECEIDRVQVRKLYDERFMVAFPAGHRFNSFASVPIFEVAHEAYLARMNCEYNDTFEEILDERKIALGDVYRSEREDWIQSMIVGGMGISFLPEYSAVIPGLNIRPIVDPVVTRQVCLITISGRRYSPAVKAFIRAVDAYSWPTVASSSVAA